MQNKYILDMMIAEGLPVRVINDTIQGQNGQPVDVTKAIVEGATIAVCCDGDFKEGTSLWFLYRDPNFKHTFSTSSEVSIRKECENEDFARAQVQQFAESYRKFLGSVE